MSGPIDDRTGTAGIAPRPDRGVVAIGGADAIGFLARLVTCTIEGLAPGEARFGGLLGPQGKLLFDFFLVRRDDGFLVEIERARVAEFLRRLAFYRLRAAVSLDDRSDDFEVFVAWGDGADPAATVAFDDPRLAGLGRHLLVARPATVVATATLADWHRHRIGLGVPESGRDHELGDLFPHDVDMDDLGGIDFTKGCYVGQEVVSRMRHRGTARRRFVLAEAGDGGSLPPPGTEIAAADRPLGVLGSSAGARGLALVRLDRVRAAIDAGEAIAAAGVPLTLTLPGFARFGWPAAAGD
jgi:folate-binding protein YgfZ